MGRKWRLRTAPQILAASRRVTGTARNPSRRRVRGHRPTQGLVTARATQYSIHFCQVSQADVTIMLRWIWAAPSGRRPGRGAAEGQEAVFLKLILFLPMRCPGSPLHKELLLPALNEKKVESFQIHTAADTIRPLDVCRWLLLLKAMQIFCP